MKAEIKTGLQELFQKKEEQKRASEQRSSAEKERKERNLAAFDSAKNSTIRPALSEIVQLYRERGLPAQILERDEEEKSNGGTNSPYIRLMLEDDKYTYSSDMKAAFTVYFNKDKNEVWIHKSTRSSSGSGESLALDHVSSDWIHEQFLKYASQPF